MAVILKILLSPFIWGFRLEAYQLYTVVAI